MADIENGEQEESFTETNGDFDTSQFDPEATDADTSAITTEDVGVEDPVRINTLETYDYSC